MQPILEIEKAKKVLENTKGSSFVLGPISFSVNKGEFLVIRGSNGSGKSTLLSCISNEQILTSGNIKWHNSIQLGDFLVLCQNYRDLAFPWMTCSENVEIVKKTIWKHISDSDYQQMLTTHLPPALSGKLETPAHTLSGGELQAMIICRILMANPKVLLFDEPFSNIDAESASFFWDLLIKKCAAKKLSCLVVAHHLPLNKISPRTLFLKNGLLAHDEGEIG